MSEQSTMPNTSSVLFAQPPVVEVPKFNAALEDLTPEFMAMEAPEYPVIVNVDVPSVVSSLLGKALLRINSYRPAIVEHLPKYDITLFDKLEPVTMALSRTNTLYNAAYGGAPELQRLYEQASAIYEVMLAEAHAQVLRKRMPGDRLKDLRPNIGYRNTAGNLFALTQIYRANWATLEGKTGTTKEELDAADRAAEALTRAIGDREAAPEAIAAAADLQQRAFNMFLKVYDHVLCAISHLRWKEGDAQVIVPPIYTGKGPGKRKIGEQKPEPTPPVQVPPASTGQHAAAASSGLPVGLPGGDPLEDAE